MKRGIIWTSVVCAAALIAAVSTIGLAQSQTADLRAPGDFAQIADRKARSAAIFTEMGKVIQHPRCLNCHPRNDRPTQGNGRPHSPPVQRGPAGIGVAGMECTVCHGPANVPFANGRGSIPGHPTWHLAPSEMAWQGVSLRGICEQLKDRKRNGNKDLDAFVIHMAEDKLVDWGWRPGGNRKPVPIPKDETVAAVKAWVAAGAPCPSS